MCSAPFSADPEAPQRGWRGVVVLLVGVWLGGHPSWLPSPVRERRSRDNSNGQFVNQVLDVAARKDYYRPIDREPARQQGAGRRRSPSLNDPYSHYYDPADVQGVPEPGQPAPERDRGRRPERVAGGCAWSTCSPRSPAAKAGLARGDVIVAVGATSLANRSADFGSRLIRGKAGSKVTLTILRGGQQADDHGYAREHRRAGREQQDRQLPRQEDRLRRSSRSFTDGSGAELRGPGRQGAPPGRPRR